MLGCNWEHEILAEFALLLLLRRVEQRDLKQQGKSTEFIYSPHVSTWESHLHSDDQNFQNTTTCDLLLLVLRGGVHDLQQHTG